MLGLNELHEAKLHELNELKKKTESCSVDTALMALQALVGRPPVLFDSYAATAAVEEVVHLEQKYADERYSRYQIILRKCHPLVADASLQNILIKLVASKEEAEIGKAIEKARKSNEKVDSNTTDRYESSNVFTSRTTRMSHLMYSRVVRPVPLTRETNSFSSHTTEP